MFDADGEWIVRIHSQVQHFAQLQRRIAVRTHSLNVPTRQMLAEMLEVAFWASLTSNEGRPTRVRMVMLRAGFSDDVLAFKHSMPYTEDEIAQLAPATSATAWLAVDMMDQPGRIWGLSRKPIYDRLDAVTVEVTDPGTIRVGFGPFQSFVVFAGRSTTSPHGARDMALTARLRSALGKDLYAKGVVGSDTVWRECLALGFLARMVLEDRHGGTLLVVPTNTHDWMDSLVPFTHEFVQPDSSIRDSIRAVLRQGASDGKAFAMLDQSDVSEDVKDAMFAVLSQVNWYPEGVLRPVARLAAVDGAVVLTADLNVLGFGAMISTESVPDVYLARPWPEDVLEVNIEEAGGARHQSAIRFVGRHRGSVALVISHDRHLSLAHWSPQHDGVWLLKNADWWI
jgi:hypothetical protein